MDYSANPFLLHRTTGKLQAENKGNTEFYEALQLLCLSSQGLTSDTGNTKYYVDYRQKKK